MAMITVTLPDGTKAQVDDKNIVRQQAQKAQAPAKDYSGAFKGSKLNDKIPEPVKRATGQAERPYVKPAEKDYTQMARDVMAGKYGTGEARKKALGTDYVKVQTLVNQLVAKDKAPVQQPAPAEKPAPQPAPPPAMRQTSVKEKTMLPEKGRNGALGWDDARTEAFNKWSGDKGLSRFRNSLRNQMLYSGKYAGMTQPEFETAYSDALKSIYNMGGASGGATADMLRSYQGTLGINDISGGGLLDSALAKSINKSWNQESRLLPDGVTPGQFGMGPGGY